MKKNTRMNVRMTAVPKYGMLLVALVVVAALSYWFADSKCHQLGQEILKHEQKNMSLENEWIRETARWNKNKTPEVLEKVEKDFDMAIPLAEQIVRVDASGRVLPRQVSVARFYVIAGSEGKASR